MEETDTAAGLRINHIGAVVKARQQENNRTGAQEQVNAHAQDAVNVSERYNSAAHSDDEDEDETTTATTTMATTTTATTRAHAPAGKPLRARTSAPGAAPTPTQPGARRAR